MLKAVIFDKDGVLVDTEVLIVEAMNATVRKFHGTREYTLSDRMVYGGRSAHETFPVMKEEFQMKGNLDEMLSYYQTIYTQIINEKGVNVFEGVKELLEELKKDGIERAVGTGSGKERTDMTMADLTSFFNTVVTSDDVKNPKPAPDTFLLGAERLGVDPSECVVIGDSMNDSEGAYLAGMKFIFRNSLDSADKLKYKPDLVVENIKDLKVEGIKALFE